MMVSSLTDPQLVTLLTRSAVGILRTDTVYGVVAQAQDSQAVAKLYRAKSREGKPGTVIAANVQQLVALGLSAADLAQVSHLWPASVSVVLPAPAQLEYLDQGKKSLAVRIPASASLRLLLEQTGPLLTSSANQPGQPEATTIKEAQHYFGDSVDFYVDGGPVINGQASTVVRLLPGGAFELLRQGSVAVKTAGE